MHKQKTTGNFPYLSRKFPVHLFFPVEEYTVSTADNYPRHESKAASPPARQPAQARHKIPPFHLKKLLPFPVCLPDGIAGMKYNIVIAIPVLSHHTQVFGILSIEIFTQMYPAINQSGEISADIRPVAQSTATIVILMVMSKLERIMQIFSGYGASIFSFQLQGIKFSPSTFRRKPCTSKDTSAFCDNALMISSEKSSASKEPK